MESKDNLIIGELYKVKRQFIYKASRADGFHDLDDNLVSMAYPDDLFIPLSTKLFDEYYVCYHVNKGNYFRFNLFSQDVVDLYSEKL